MILLTLLSGEVLANNYAECYGCTSTEMKKKAEFRGMEELFYSSPGDSTTVNVINIVENKVETYKIWLRPSDSSSAFPGRYIPYALLTPTSNDVKESMTSLKLARNNLAKASGELIIPSTEISNAWQVTNCAFCENNIERFVNNSLNGQILTVQLTLQEIARMFGLIQTGLSDNYRIKLESGGYVEVTMHLTAPPSTLKIVLTKTVDQNGNTVPLNKSGLDGLKLQMPSLDMATTVNAFLNGHSYYITIRMGFVTVRDCLNTPEGNYPRCP